MILNILNKLAETSSTKQKEAILKKMSYDNVLKDTFRLAYNKRIVFGIKKVPTEFHKEEKHTSLQHVLWELENTFATRKVTGNAATAHLTRLMSMLLDPNDREVVRRVIKRDLECGTSDSIANKVWKDLVPSQPCMLATAQSDKALAKIQYPAIAQLKADGARCMVIKQDGVVTAWSRNGKEYTGIEPILKALREYKEDNFVLDGELVYKSNLGKKPELPELELETVRPSIMGDLSWMLGEQEREPELSKAKEFQEQDVVDRQTGNGIVSKAQKGTLTEAEANNIVLQVWDFIEADKYFAGKDERRYKTRMDLAKQTINLMKSPNIEFIETHVVYSLHEAEKIYNQYIELELEGIILKNMNAPWEDKRSANLVKFKQVIEFDAIVIGYYPHKKDPSKLGGLTIESKCGQIRCNVGSGFKDKTTQKVEGVLQEIPINLRHEYDRSRVLSEIQDWLDSVVQIECNGVVKRKNMKEGDAPFKFFLPTFQLRRFDKDKKDANTLEEIFG